MNVQRTGSIFHSMNFSYTDEGREMCELNNNKDNLSPELDWYMVRFLLFGSDFPNGAHFWNNNEKYRDI